MLEAWHSGRRGGCVRGGDGQTDSDRQLFWIKQQLKCCWWGNVSLHKLGEEDDPSAAAAATASGAPEEVAEHRAMVRALGVMGQPPSQPSQRFHC